MAKKIDNNEKRRNYNIERIRTPMDRSELSKLYNEYINKYKKKDDYSSSFIILVTSSKVKSYSLILAKSEILTTS